MHFMIDRLRQRHAVARRNRTIEAALSRAGSAPAMRDELLAMMNR
jgi:hypothetical protein